jgi:hypothetical protein
VRNGEVTVEARACENGSKPSARSVIVNVLSCPATELTDDSRAMVKRMLPPNCSTSMMVWPILEVHAPAIGPRPAHVTAAKHQEAAANNMNLTALRSTLFSLI